MAFLAGPGVTDLVIASALSRDTPASTPMMVGDPVELAIIQLLQSMGQLTSLLVMLQKRRRLDTVLTGERESEL